MDMRSFTKFLPAAIVAAMLCAPVLAVEILDVSVLLRAKQYGAALARTDQQLAASPGEPRMRFLRGLALAGMGRRDDAIACFSKLTADYPELPEPYNNLAVLHAANGQYDKARAALEGAVKANPAYARAHENLADMYLQLASQSYAATLEIEPHHAGAHARQALLRSILGDRGERAVPAPAAVPPTPAKIVRDDRHQ